MRADSKDLSQLLGLAEARRIYPEATMEQVRRVKSGEFAAGLVLSSARMRKG